MDRSDQFVLLIGSYQAAGEGSDLSFCMAAIDSLSHAFAVDAATTKIQCALKSGFKADSPALTAANCSRGLDLVAQLVSGDRVTDAVRVLGILKGPASVDPALAALVKKQSRKLDAIQAQRMKIAKDVEKLRTSPRDPAANQAVGEYLCYYLGSWEQGLPLLQNGTDAKIKRIAATELQNSTDASARAELADEWWTAAASQAEMSRAALRQHAVAIYGDVLPDVTGLRRIAISKRIDEASGDSDRRVVDFLRLIDVTKDTLSGNFSLTSSGLAVKKADNARLQIPYQPPEEYDLNMEFSYDSDDSAMVFILPLADGPVQLELKPNSNRFAHEDGDALRGTGPFAEKGRPNRAVVKVRLNVVQVYLNSALVIELMRTRQPIGMKSSWKMRSKDVMGLGSYQSDATFSKLTLTEISGHGKPIKG